MKLPFPKDQRKEIWGRAFVAAFAIGFAALLYHFGEIWGFISKLGDLASPFFLGFGIAFLLVPVQRFVERALTASLYRRSARRRGMRFLSTLLSMLFLLAIVYVFLNIMMPQVVRSIQSIAGYISKFLTDNRERLNQLLVKYDFLSFDGDEVVVAWENIVSSQIQNITALLSNLMLISRTIVNFFYELLVSLITAFYILMDKDHLAAQIKKIGYSLMRRERIEELIYWTRRANRIFAGFISGKIVDSAIIGVICYVGMLIFRMEYPMLISIVIGITNIIPFFGPFIGWAPCALILLLVNPMSALWFSLFILFLQQLDGNVIGPHILGDYVGVSALSIMIAIVIGGGLFGFTGMLLSVPVYALGYAFVRTLLHTKLKRRGLPTDTNEYVRAPENLAQAGAKEDESNEAD